MLLGLNKTLQASGRKTFCKGRTLPFFSLPVQDRSYTSVDADHSASASYCVLPYLLASSRRTFDWTDLNRLAQGYRRDILVIKHLSGASQVRLNERGFDELINEFRPGFPPA